MKKIINTEFRESNLPEHSWPQPFCDDQNLASSHETHKPNEVNHFLPNHEHHFGQGKPVEYSER